MPRPTASPRVCGSTSCSTTSSPGRTRPGRSGSRATASAWRPLVHIRDIAKATVALLEAPAASVRGEAFNIGTNEQNYRIRDLAEIVRARLPDCEVTFAAGATADPRSYRVDFSKFAERFPDCVLDWTAERGADELATAYERIGLEEAELTGSRYLRLGRLRLLLDEKELREGLRWRTSA